MAYTSEIEKLEARYRENPKGRNFAPLADAYRKAGLIDNAIELCQAGLALHPDYVSGHIVHGRCLVDKKDDVGAEGVFRKVLDLDPENILALKVLAEIAERNNYFDQAMEWLNRLLLADPMNGEAAEGLSRVRGKASVQPAEPAPAPVATLVVEPHAEPQVQVEHEEVELQVDQQGSSQAALGIESMEGPFDPRAAEAATASMERPDFVLERTSESSPDASVTAPTAAVPFDGLDFNAVAPEPVLADGLELEEAPEIAPDQSVEVEGLARTQYEGSGLFKVDGSVESVPFEERPTSPVADLPLIMPEDVEPAPTASAPSSVRYSREVEPVESRSVAPPASAAPAPPALGLPDDDDGAADTAALSQAEPVLTETMAELYLRQGHREDALRVYQALAVQRPHDVRLRDKIDELEAPQRSRASGSGQSAGAFLKGILNARPGAPAPAVPVPQAARALAPPPPAPPPEEVAAATDADGPASDNHPGESAPGSPTRPASDAISLDSVFGEESGRASAPSSESEADSGSGPPAGGGGGFSFDDFFGTAAAPGGGNKPASPNARPSRPSGRTRAPEKEEDLDQFQAWLKSLKA